MITNLVMQAAADLARATADLSDEDFARVVAATALRRALKAPTEVEIEALATNLRVELP